MPRSARYSELVASGITLNGFKFMAVRVDSEQVIGRKGQRGVFIIPTQQAILIAEVSPRPDSFISELS